MILEKQKEAQIFADGETQESIGMSLDLDSAQVLMQMLSKNLYSDAIGSTIRECASNALDSHRRAKVDKPIIVSFGINNESNYEFSVEDFGVGLDHMDVTNIISKYGKSTKRDSTTELGMMGLGFKAPLAYSSSFYFIARKNHIERKYMMYEGEDTNTIDLLYTTPTSEPNGVKVIIPVSYVDRYDFAYKISKQLAYFESVYFNVADLPSAYNYGKYYSADSINNNFVIFRGDDFQWSEISEDRDLHICLDNVYYPLDFDKLGISRIELPIAMRFSLTDGIFPTPNREAIRYTQEAKKVILAKLGKVADFFCSKYNDSIVETDDIRKIFEYYETDGKWVNISDKKYRINDLLPYANLTFNKPKLKGVELLDLQSLYSRRAFILNTEYAVKYVFERGKMRSQEDMYYNDIRINQIGERTHYIFSGNISGVMKEYLRATLPYGSSCKFVKKVASYKLNSPIPNHSYNTVLQLNSHPKSEWRQRIKEFQYIQSLFTDMFVNLDEIVIPQQWLDARKKQRVSVTNGGTRRMKLQGEVVGKLAKPLERYVNGKNCKFVPETLNVAKITTTNTLFVYTNHDNADKLDPLYYIVGGKQKVSCITFSDREIKVLEKLEIHNLMSYEKFMEGKNKPFKRLITAYLINSLIVKYNHTFVKADHLKEVSTDLYNKIQELYTYKNENYCVASVKIYESMLEVANENNLFDHSIYSTYLEIKSLLSKLTFIEVLMKEMSAYGEDAGLTSALCDLFKYYKQRINYTNYKIKLNEELPSGEALEQEVVNQLETI